MYLICGFALALVVTGLPAQEDKREKGDLEAALEEYLAEGQPGEGLEQKTVDAVLDAASKGYSLLSTRLRTAQQEEEKGVGPGSVRYRQLRSLMEKVGVGYMRRAVESEMVFAGQYDELRVLQPWMGEFYLTILIDTPDWFPSDNRYLVVPALRDLFLASPGEDVLDELREIASDTDFEEEELRESVGLALAQWGDRSFVAKKIKDLERRAEGKEAEGRVIALGELANLHYALRDYKTSAATWKRMLRDAEGNKKRLTPAHYYNAACSMSLSGDLESALTELENCFRLQASGRVDPSLHLERELFAKDPDIRAIRKTKRFQRLYNEAFAKQKEAADRRKDGDHRE